MRAWWTPNTVFLSALCKCAKNTSRRGRNFSARLGRPRRWLDVLHKLPQLPQSGIWPRVDLYFVFRPLAALSEVGQVVMLAEPRENAQEQRAGLQHNNRVVGYIRQTYKFITIYLRIPITIIIIIITIIIIAIIIMMIIIIIVTLSSTKCNATSLQGLHSNNMICVTVLCNII